MHRILTDIMPSDSNDALFYVFQKINGQLSGMFKFYLAGDDNRGILCGNTGEIFDTNAWVADSCGCGPSCFWSI